MKHNSDCSQEENDRRWRSYAQLRGARVPFGDLPQATRQAAARLNRVLTELEHAVMAEMGPTLATLLSRKRDPADTLEDFDAALTLSYGLHASDREWDANEENLLCVQTVSLYDGEDLHHDDGFGRPLRHLPWTDWRHDEPPCWTFALLMAHSGIAWEDIPRIASIQRTLIVKTDETPVLLGTTVVAVPGENPEST